MRYRKGVFCVIYSVQNNKIQYLLLHRKLHWKGWEFVKGGRKLFESLRVTAKREVKEETGLKVKFLSKMNYKDKFNYDKKSQADWKARGFRFIVFVCLVEKGRVRIDKKEHDKYIWIAYNQALRLLKWSNQKKALKITNKWLKSKDKK
jgi:8-oxo-dGTP pyrophosphatase MutT (NUDIX family)